MGLDDLPIGIKMNAMKTAPLSASLLVLLALGACGNAEEPAPAEAPAADEAAMTPVPSAADTVLAKAETSDGPEIGDRIPEPDADSSGGGMAAAGAEAHQEAKDLAARGVM